MQFAKTSGFAALQFGRLSKKTICQLRSPARRKSEQVAKICNAVAVFFLCKPPFSSILGLLFREKKSKEKLACFKFSSSTRGNVLRAAHTGRRHSEVHRTKSSFFSFLWKKPLGFFVESRCVFFPSCVYVRSCPHVVLLRTVLLRCMDSAAAARLLLHTVLYIQGRNGVSFLQKRGFFAVWLFRMSLLLPSSIFVLPEAKVPLNSHNCDD